MKFGFVVSAGDISLRFIEEEQYDELLVVLRKYLDESKILFQVDRMKMKFIERNE